MRTLVRDTKVEEIAKFCIEEGKGLYNHLALNNLCEAIAMHIEFNTLLVLKDSEGIAVLCRWDILNDGKEAKIIDFIIRENYRNRKIIRSVLLYGLGMFPSVKTLSYDKFKDGSIVRKGLHSVDKLLRRRI